MISKKQQNKMTGKITPNGVSLEKHEEKTVLSFTNSGNNIEYIRPTNVPGMKNPDILMNGKIWEMKAPEKYNEKTLRNRFHGGAKQSSNIIFDLRRLKTKDRENACRDLQRHFKMSKQVKNLMIIKNDDEVLHFSK